MREYLIHNVTVVTGDSAAIGSIAISDGRIEEIWRPEADNTVIYGDRRIPFAGLAAQYASDHPEAEIMEMPGMTAFAGGIDAHVHFREPGMTHKADIGSESLAALLGGVTSFMDMPNTNPPTTSSARLAEKLELAEGRSWANYGFHIGATNGNREELETMSRDEGAVDRPGRHDFGGIKVFMGSSTGNMLVDDSNALDSLFRIKEKEILVHSEDEATIRKNLADAEARYGEDIPFSAHKDIRSRRACVISTIKALEMAMKHGTRLHLLHVTTAEEVQMIRVAKEINPYITAETSANYLWFCSDDYDRLGSRVKCNPSVKDADDRAALREALRTGIIDTIGSDHAPHLLSEKERKYLQAPSGLPSIRQTLPVLLTVASEEGIPFTRIASVFSEKAAEMFGIRDRGFLRKGYMADITIVAPDEEYTVTEDTDGYKCGWTPYEGTRLRGKVKAVFLNGKLRVKDGKTTEDSPSGQRLAF